MGCQCVFKIGGGEWVEIAVAQYPSRCRERAVGLRFVFAVYLAAFCVEDWSRNVFAYSCEGYNYLLSCLQEFFISSSNK